MRLLIALALATSLVACAPVPVSHTAAPGQPARQIPLRDFFKNREQNAHQLSEDGRYLSWTAPY